MIIETIRVKMMLTQKFQPIIIENKNNRYALNATTAPCAKFTNLEVEYIKENPDATKA